MDSLPVDLAFSRLGADVTGRQRPLCAAARDGSLVLVCQSPGFSRPSAGVLRYSAKLSQVAGRRSQIEALRVGLEAANAARTPVRLIVKAPAVGTVAARVHIRADLVGSVFEFDGDAYSVDFVRLVAEEPELPVRSNRRR